MSITLILIGSTQVVQKNGDMCYSMTINGKEVVKPVAESLTEIFKKLYGEYHNMECVVQAVLYLVLMSLNSTFSVCLIVE